MMARRCAIDNKPLGEAPSIYYFYTGAALREHIEYGVSEVNNSANKTKLKLETKKESQNNSSLQINTSGIYTKGITTISFKSNNKFFLTGPYGNGNLRKSHNDIMRLPQRKVMKTKEVVGGQLVWDETIFSGLYHFDGNNKKDNNIYDTTPSNNNNNDIREQEQGEEEFFYNKDLFESLVGMRGFYKRDRERRWITLGDFCYDWLRVYGI